MTMVSLETHQAHMEQVRKYRKHASDGCPQQARIGDWLLVQVTSGRPGNETLDGEAVARLMIEHDVGVTLEAAYEVKRVDSDYFAEE